MGWLYMPESSMGLHRTPKAYLDNQLTYERPAEGDQPFSALRVLKSACPGNRTYYAAVERYDEAGSSLQVFAIVCLVRWNPRASDNMIFGYKDMDEQAGPCEADCPASILDLLTSTDHPFALDWRRRCHANLRRRSRDVPDGALIRFHGEIGFTDGSRHSEFRVKREGRKIVLTPKDGGGRYTISRLMDRNFEIVRETKVAKTFFPSA